MNDLGVKVNRTCGLHVHFGARDLTLHHWRNVLKYYLKYEKVIDSLVAPSRRGDSNEFCHSLYNCFDRGGLTRDTLESAYAAIDRATTLRELAQTATYADRYYKVNLMAFWVHGTVEIRQHQGTTDYEKMAAWISLMQGLIEKAVFRPCAPSITKGDSLPSLLERCHVSRYTHAYLMERASALA